jgi:hypothetical protein
MKTAILLLVATVGLQAQTPSSTPSQSTAPDRQQPQPSTSGSSIGNPSGQVTSPSNPTNTSGQFQTDAQRREEERKRDEERKRNEANRSAQNQPDAQARSSSNSQTSSQQSTTQINQGSSTNVAVSGETDVQVKTVVQQIDAQGPAVVQRISTRFADVACSEENARLLVEALHNGSSVTLRGDDGKTATFTPNVKLGYGEAYIAMALAAEALQKAGITGCATPEQWQAVLMGGQLSGGTVRTTSVTTERFPGILVLHSQGGGWTKVAQTTNVELNQVVSQANTSLQIDNSQQLSPTGRSSDYDPYKTDDKNKPHDPNKPGHELKSQQEKEQDASKTNAPRKQGQEMNPPAADDPNNPSSTEQPQARPNY